MPYRGDFTYRLVELQLMLAERPRSQQELVQHFQVNRKTIRKDIDALSRHHPITDERVGRHVMYPRFRTMHVSLSSSASKVTLCL